MQTEEPQVDLDLQSRVVGVYGLETLGKLTKFRVFIQGLRGIGIETAKNLMLAGPRQIVIHDNSLVRVQDLGSNFFLTNDDIGKRSRAQASLAKLKELNPSVDTSIYEGELNEEFLGNFNVVIFTDFYDKAQLCKWNNFLRTREIPTGFIWTGLLGLYGFAFVDFGNGFKVFDPTGEEPKQVLISMITQQNPAICTTLEGKLHGLLDGEVVKFREVEGMTELNGNQYKIKEINPYSFSIEVDTTNFGQYQRNGIADQVKVEQAIPFKSLEESLKNPHGNGLPTEFDNPDLDKWGRPQELHYALNAVLAFYTKNGRLPKLNNSDDASALQTFFFDHTKAAENNGSGDEKVPEINKELIQNIAKYAEANLSPHASFWGGIVAQEAVKNLGKFMPLRQWLHYENFECLPEGDVNRTLRNNRYDDVIAIFGHEYQEKLSNQKFFLIGAGALGCEFLKMFALVGLGCGPSGKVIVTDDDTIEVSNLTRQFLFRKENVKSSKSETAEKVVRGMNPDFNVQAVKLRTSPENENFFNDDFWESLDGVTNAVDNVKAREYIDGKCVFHGKPLFESGTLGTKCNSQVILPKMTQSYTDSKDPEEKDIPLCTLKNFPYQIEHTIQWARAFFDDNFVDAPNQYAKFQENPKEYLEATKKELKQIVQLKGRLESLVKIADLTKNATHDTCIEAARIFFQDTFNNMIAELIYNLPEDHLTEGGQKFWSGTHRFPQIINFDPNDETHANYIFACANLFAFVLKLDPITDRNYVCKKASDMKFEKYSPKKKAIKLNEADSKEETTGEDDEKVVAELLEKLTKVDTSHKIETIEFEKDNDKNHHIDFISALANLRARNYRIDEVPRHKVKQIAGRIIPAIATATAMIVGAVGFEILKYLGGKKLSAFRNSFCNLALPLWLFSEPLATIKTQDKEYDEVALGPIKAIPSGWSKWEKIDIEGPKTMEEIADHFAKNYNVKTFGIQVGNDLIYAITPPHNSRGKMTPEEAYHAETGKELAKSSKYICLGLSGDTIDDGVEVRMPMIRYKRV